MFRLFRAFTFTLIFLASFIAGLGLAAFTIPEIRTLVSTLGGEFVEFSFWPVLSSQKQEQKQATFVPNMISIEEQRRIEAEKNQSKQAQNKQPKIKKPALFEQEPPPIIKIPATLERRLERIDSDEPSLPWAKKRKPLPDNPLSKLEKQNKESIETVNLREGMDGIFDIFTVAYAPIEPLAESLMDYEKRLAGKNKTLNPDFKADHIIVEKSKRLLHLYKEGRLYKSYPISLGPAPKGHKQFEGDGRTPEGVYTIDWRNPNSRFYRSLHISYPNKEDKAYAQSAGKSAGGAIMIHGLPNGVETMDNPGIDWTEGCIAMADNKAMDELWTHVQDHTKITLRP